MGIWGDHPPSLNTTPVSYTHLDVYKRQVQPQNPRSLSAEALADEAKHFCKDVQPAQSMKDAIEKATVSGDEVLVICGSFFLASEIRDLAIEKYKA